MWSKITKYLSAEVYKIYLLSLWSKNTLTNRWIILGMFQCFSFVIGWSNWRKEIGKQILVPFAILHSKIIPYIFISCHHFFHSFKLPITVIFFHFQMAFFCCFLNRNLILIKFIYLSSSLLLAVCVYIVWYTSSINSSKLTTFIFK